MRPSGECHVPRGVGNVVAKSSFIPLHRRHIEMQVGYSVRLFGSGNCRQPPHPSSQCKEMERTKTISERATGRIGIDQQQLRPKIVSGFKGHSGRRASSIVHLCAALSRSSESAREELRDGRMSEKTSELPTGETDSVSAVDGKIAGMIYPPLTTVGKSTNILWQECMVKRADRQKMLGQKGCVVWITGLSGSGKSTLACTLEHVLLQQGRMSYVLDGDNVRHGLNKNLGFSAEDRTENIRRVGEVAKLFADAGIICIASFISPYQKDRDACRKLLLPGEFIEVYMNVPLTVCELRDRKGLYKLARAGKIKGFTGIDDPYEEPQHSEIVMQAVGGVYASPQEMAAQVLAYLKDKGLIQPEN